MNEEFVICYFERPTGEVIEVAIDPGLEGVVRFSETEGAVYPQEFFTGLDDDLVHTWGCIGMAFAQINPPEGSGFSIERLVELLGRHDLDELVRGDHPVLLEGHLDPTALSPILQGSMSPEQFQDYLEVEQARLFLKEGDLSKLPSAEALVATILDSVQGNSTFFEIISYNVCVRGVDPHDPRIQRLIEMGEGYFNKMHELYLASLDRLPDTPSYAYARTIAQLFLTQQSESIKYVKAEINCGSSVIRELRGNIFGLMGSLNTYLTMSRDLTMPTSETITISDLLQQYLGSTVMDKGPNSPLGRTLQSLRTLRVKSFGPDTIIHSIEFGLLEAWRFGLYKHSYLEGLVDPDVRKELAKWIQEKFNELL